MNNLSDIFSCCHDDTLLFTKTVPDWQIYEEANCNGFVAIIEDAVVNPANKVVFLLKPGEPSVNRQIRTVDVCRQLIAVASNSDDNTAIIENYDAKFPTMKSGLYRVMKEQNINVRMKLQIENQVVVVTLDRYRSVNSVRKIMQGLVSGQNQVAIPIAVNGNKNSLVTMVHQTAQQLGVKVRTRSDRNMIKVSLIKGEVVTRGCNAELRCRIDLLPWDTPTPLVTPDKSALLSTLAAQHPHACFTVQRGIITRHSAIMKRSQGQKVLRVFGEVVYTGEDTKEIEKVLSRYGKTLEDLA